GSPNGAGDACSFYGSGETEDYTITVDIGNGIVKNEAVEAIGLYPNPANNTVIVLLSKEIEFPAKLVLTNMLGELISETSISTYRTELTLTDYPKGIYFVSVVSKQGSSYKKLVKE
nr:T9SS type A sorting domain-containing protein [Bacteroidia bacterium]